MKKALKILGGCIIVILVALLIIPLLFKDKLKQMLIDEFAKQTTATLYFGDVSLSAFRSFPNLDFGIDDFGIVGTGFFEGDTLISSRAFHTSIGMKELIFDNQVIVKSISLEDPTLTFLSLSDGHVNYDIMRPTEVLDDGEEQVDSNSIDLALEKVEIINGRIIYFDQQLKTMLDLEEINIESSAFYKEDVLDLLTEGKIGDIEFIFEDVYLVSQKTLGINATVSADLDIGHYRFKENRFKINALPFNVDGGFEMQANGDYQMDISFDSPNGTLKDLLSLVPSVYGDDFNDLQADGNISFSGHISGLYNDHETPSYDLFIGISEGEFGYQEVPAKIDQLNMQLALESPKGQLPTSALELSKLEFLLADNPFEAQMRLKNFVSPSWNVKAKGAIDLESLASLLPITHQLEGMIDMNLSTSGKMMDLEQARYEKLPLNGSLDVSNFKISGEELDYDLSIDQLSSDFNEQQVILKSMTGKSGSSTFNLSGRLQDFVPYVLWKETLKGRLDLKADQLLLNEWITEPEQDQEVASSEEQTEAIRIPENIDFSMKALLEKLDYDGLRLDNVNADIHIVDGQLIVQNSGFNAVQGNFSARGKYDSRPIQPVFNMNIEVASVSIRESYEQFVAIQKFAPIAEQTTGNLGLSFNLGGMLKADMLPDYSTMTGTGVIEVLKAGLESPAFTQGLSSTLKVTKIENPILERIKMQGAILEGRFFVKPFEIKLGDYQTTIGGSTGIDGSLDYNLLITVPARQLTQQVNSLAQQYLNTDLAGGNAYIFDVALSGLYSSPKFKLQNVMTQEGRSPEQIVTKKIEEEIEAKKEELQAQAQEKIEDVKDSLNTVLDQKLKQGELQLDSLIADKSDSLTIEALKKIGATEMKDSTAVQVKEKAKDLLEGLLKRKKKKKDNDNL
jgi:hypothetical protein